MTFRDDASRDFGGLVRRTPARVLAPATIDELRAVIAELAAQRTPYKLRGAAHSASGEVLGDQAVIDLTHLAGVTGDGGDTITALGGTRWLAVWEHLAARGRRPLTLTDNPRVTLGGTLTAGGVGDASHIYGPQVAGVRRIVLVTPDGARHELVPGDPLFDHALCGHGQLGAIAEVTLATRRASSTIHGRLAHWLTLDGFFSDIATVEHDYVRGRIVWNEGLVRARAIIGDSARPAAPTLSHAMQVSPPESLDMLAEMRVDRSAQYAPYNPCLELVLPYPAGLPALRTIDGMVARSSLIRFLPRGSSLQLLAGTHALPLSPFHGDRVIVLALRPEAHTLDDAHACDAPLRAIADAALAAGGRIYLASFQLGARALGGQLGALPQLAAQVDPDALCNRGSLHGWQRSITSV